MVDQKAPTLPNVVAKTRTERAAAALKRIEDAAVYAEQYVVAHVPSSPAASAQQWVWPVFSWLLVLFNVLLMMLVLHDMWQFGYKPLAHAVALAASVGSFAFMALTHRLALAMPNTVPGPNTITLAPGSSITGAPAAPVSTGGQL